MAMKKDPPKATPVTDGYAATDPVMARATPNLFEYLAAVTWDDGSARETSTLMVLCEQGVFKGCVNDRDGHRSCWVSAGSLKGLLEALENVLASGEADWRVKQATNGRRRN